MRYFFGLFLIAYSFISCKTGMKNTHRASADVVVVLDSLEAAKVITLDQYTDFFKSINILDMSIQTKSDLSKKTRATALQYYKSYLQKDVESFSEHEVLAIKKLCKEIKNSCDKISKDIYPPHLQLIKTKANHYGDGVYYTRNQAVIIPKDALESIGSPRFKSTMFHEIFHIFSRLHPEKRKELYKLIGFQEVSSIDKLAMNKRLKDKILLNPDGVNYAVSIQLMDKNNNYVDAFPIIFSNQLKYTKAKPNFFNYIAFDLYEVKHNSGRYEVVSDVKGNATLNPAFMNSFFEQIKDNTQYTIHPDEILADNFAILMGLKASKESKVVLSKEGETLIKEVERVLRN